LLFSVNVKDAFPLILARVSQDIGIYTLHLLDYWNGYHSRMALDGNVIFEPEKYLVPDEYAAQKAQEEGIKKYKIKVTGQPAFADSLSAYQAARKQSANYDISKNKMDFDRIILFVSEPVGLDQGYSIQQNLEYRGYTEADVLEILLSSICENTQKTGVLVLPHPRQNADQLEELWVKLGGKQYGYIVRNLRGRNLLPFAEGVAGMSSTLLYEAWLVGKPVISIQPGLRNESLRMMQDREGVVFIDDYKIAHRKVRDWLLSLDTDSEISMKPDFERHRNAPALIASIAISYMEHHKRPEMERDIS